MANVNALFAGASKCGSDWLFSLFREHPQVYVPIAKELRYFGEEFGRGAQWYERHYASARSDQINIEVCHDYLRDPEALKRIHDYNPNMKIICICRDPFDRALSCYDFFCRNGDNQGSLIKQAAKYPEIFVEGRYGDHLDCVYSHFDKSQVLVILFDDIKNEPENVSRQLFEFLGIPIVTLESALQRANVSSTPRSVWMARLAKKLALSLRSIGLANLIGVIKSQTLVRKVLYSPKEQTRVVSMEDFPEDIIELFNQHITRVEEYVGRDLSNWRGESNAS